MNTRRTHDRCTTFATGYSPAAAQSLAAGFASIELMRFRGGTRYSLWYREVMERGNRPEKSLLLLRLVGVAEHEMRGHVDCFGARERTV
jgi:hypothetical protein